MKLNNEIEKMDNSKPITTINTNTLLKERYQICQQLSHKTERQTFLAQDINSQNFVIIKLLPFNSSFQWEDLKLFEREANTLKNLDHPSIPKYLDYFEVAEGFALVQTYIEAVSLEALVEYGLKFSQAEIIELAEKLLGILTYLHEQNPPVIHRDIKPSNILISNRSENGIGDIYLVDFGSVQTVASKKQGTITIVGTYGYIPLEQFSGQAVAASDLYSLGMTLIYLITGLHPAELTHVNGQVQFESNNISGKFRRWLGKLTHPHLDKRFDSAKLALTALKSKDGSSGDFLHLRPANSQVKLSRDSHKLEIVYRVTYPQTTACIFLAICWIIFICWRGLEGFFIFPMFLLSVAPMILMFLMPVLFLLKPILNSRLNLPLNLPFNRIISINSNGSLKIGVYTDTKLTKVEWTKQSSSFRAINLVAYNPGYTFDKYLDENGKEIKIWEVTVKPRLSIHAGNSEYEIGNQKLSQAELWWLGKEISDFLGLELSIIYPIPKAP